MSNLRIHSDADLNVVFMKKAMLCKLASVFGWEKSAMSRKIETVMSKRFPRLIFADSGDAFLIAKLVRGGGCGIIGSRSSLRQFI